MMSCQSERPGRLLACAPRTCRRNSICRTCGRSQRRLSNAKTSYCDRATFSFRARIVGMLSVSAVGFLNYRGEQVSVALFLFFARLIDLFGNAYNDLMITYQTLAAQPRAFLAMTGLTTAEFRDLLPAFETAYEHVYPRDRTATRKRRRWWQGGGRPSTLSSGADKLLFLLVSLKTYPPQGALGQLFG